MDIAKPVHLPADINGALAALEARGIARNLRQLVGPVGRQLDFFLARAENRMTKIWLGHLIRRAMAISDQDQALQWLEKLRQRAAGGTWAILPDGRRFTAMIEGGLPTAVQEAWSVGNAAAQASLNTGSTLLYVAGGGFMLPPTPRQCRLADEIAASFGARAEIGQHRLAPEYPFPVPVEDLCKQFLGLIEAGIPASRVVVAGDSAGATLVLSMLLRLRGERQPMPAGALLFSPWTDLAMRGWSYLTRGLSSDSPFRMETAAFAARLYLNETLPTDPAASPAYADLSGLCPLSVHCSRYDMHFDDAVLLAEQADKANVPIRLNYWSSPRHHLERFRSKDARKSIEMAGVTAREWLGRGATRTK